MQTCSTLSALGEKIRSTLSGCCWWHLFLLYGKSVLHTSLLLAALCCTFEWKKAFQIWSCGPNAYVWNNREISRHYTLQSEGPKCDSPNWWDTNKWEWKITLKENTDNPMLHSCFMLYKFSICQSKKRPLIFIILTTVLSQLCMSTMHVVSFFILICHS